jgi:iron-sulfur cluster assembly protein
MSIRLTEKAAEHVRRYLAGRGAGAGLRVRVKPTGCSGYMYVVEPADGAEGRDEVFESQGVRVIVDDESLKLLAGTELDYTREGLNEGFRFRNPNVKDTCGCGESFSI